MPTEYDWWKDNLSGMHRKTNALLLAHDFMYISVLCPASDEVILKHVRMFYIDFLFEQMTYKIDLL